MSLSRTGRPGENDPFYGARTYLPQALPIFELSLNQFHRTLAYVVIAPERLKCWTLFVALYKELIQILVIDPGVAVPNRRRAQNLSNPIYVVVQNGISNSYINTRFALEQVNARADFD